MCYLGVKSYVKYFLELPLYFKEHLCPSALGVADIVFSVSVSLGVCCLYYYKYILQKKALQRPINYLEYYSSILFVRVSLFASLVHVIQQMQHKECDSYSQLLLTRDNLCQCPCL